MGIGLSVSRAIIESHQGRLWAAENDGPGATFSFSIPCRREEGLTYNDESPASRMASAGEAA
jgi:signal transduction histidine kinase